MYPETETYYQGSTEPACLCCKSTDSLIIDCDSNRVICTLCYKEASNWLIKHLIDVYGPDLIDYEVEEEIKKYYYIKNVIEEEAGISKIVEFMKHK